MSKISVEVCGHDPKADVALGGVASEHSYSSLKAGGQSSRTTVPVPIYYYL